MADDTKKSVRKGMEPHPVEATQVADDKIVFYCSNGHRIVVKLELAGQRGKCSKCGVPVRIPPAADAPPGAQPEAPSPVPASVAEAMPAIDAGAEPVAVPEVHFAQPTAEAEQTSGAAEPPIDMFAGLVDTGDGSAAANDLGGFAMPGGEGRQQAAGPEAMVAAWSEVPTAALVARLFEEMQHGGIVEVHVSGGSVILPEFYETRWSSGSHGLFASRAADGTVTLTAVAWESIQKIVVRQVQGLPDGMFE